MSAEIITYWNGEELSYVLNAISALINSTDFNSLLKIVSYLGVMIVFMMGVLGQMKQEDWPKYVAALAVFVFVMTGTDDFAYSYDKGRTDLMRESTYFSDVDENGSGNFAFRVKEGYSHGGIAAIEYTYNGLIWFWH